MTIPPPPFFPFIRPFLYFILYVQLKFVHLFPIVKMAIKIGPVRSSADSPEIANSNNFRRLSIFDRTIECKSADQLLNLIGPKNPLVLFVWIAMALVWAVMAMPIMCSAFLMDDFCSSQKTGDNGTDSVCSPRPGTVTADFNLGSSRSYLADIATSAFVGGMAIGSIFMPWFADRKGRRSAVLCSLFLCGFFGCASAFSPNIFVFIALRFAQGLSFSGCAMLNWVLAYESIPLHLRSQSALVFGLMWVLGYCLVAPVAYFTTNWQQLIAAASGPSILFGIFYFFTIPESFHFLVAGKKLNDVKKWVEKANKCAAKAGTRAIGSTELDQFIGQIAKEKEEQRDEENERRSNASQVRHFWTDRTLILYLTVFCFLWTCDTFIYYGLSLFSAQLAGNRFVNFTLVALAEVPAYLFAPFLLEKLGRRLFTSFTHFLAASAFLAVLLNDSPKLFLVLWLIGKFAISSSFTGLFVYTSEVFPTVNRGLCMGICTAVSQGSSIFAPSVRVMAKFSSIAPMLFFGAFSFFAGLFTLLLPETKGKELPENSIRSSE